MISMLIINSQAIRSIWELSSMVSKTVRLLAVAATLALGASACGTDDGASVTQLGVDDTAGEASASASASAPSDVSTTGPTSGDGGYDYASDVSGHRLVVLDVCAISELLPSDGPMDFDAAEVIYRDGVNSVNSDGTIRSIGGFATRDDRNPALQSYYGSDTPLDDFVTAALDGTGVFEGEPDAVRRQGAQKGIQNQVMVAWVIHELNSALDKAADGNFDVADGAPHNWDEGWAFYHGAASGCAPYGTGDSRAANFDTLASDGETALANERLLEAMVVGRDALVGEDLAGAEAATTEVIKNLAVIYSQATLRYATVIETDLAEGDASAARVHQAEGYSFFRVMEAVFAENGADVGAINDFYALENDPSPGGYDVIAGALQPAWDALGITVGDIGSLS